MNRFWKYGAVILLSPPVLAGSLNDSSNRSGKWEGGFIINRVESWDISGGSGSSADIDSDTGWGFTLGYNFNEHLNLGFDFIHNEQSYDATIVSGSAPFTTVDFSHELDNDLYQFNFSYNLLATALTPFVSAGVGWSYIDSNISTGDGGLVCWYDPWWGYVCNSYYSTYSDTSFTYTLGAGLRWDLGRSFTVKASLNRRFVDLDGVSESPEFSAAKIDLIWQL